MQKWFVHYSTEINVISLGQALPSGKFGSAGGLICIDSV